MPRKQATSDISQDRQQLLNELATLRARVQSLEAALGTESAPLSHRDVTTSASHPQPYPLGDPAFPYQRMVEELSEGVVALSPTHAVRYVNRRFVALLDFSPERLLDMDFIDLIALEDRSSFEEFLNGSTQQYVELRLIAADDRRVPVQVSTRDWVVDGISTFLVVMDLSERRQDQERLTFQAFLLEHVNEAVIAVDSGFRITYWNGGAERLYGWTANEAIGQSMPELVRSRSSDAERAQVVEHLEKAESSKGEVTHYRKDGEPLRIQWNTLPIRDAAGALTGYVSVTRDITARRRIQQELQDSEQYFARVFEHSPTAILITRSADGRVLDVNDRFLQLTGYRRDKVIGRTTTELKLWDEPDGRPDFTRVRIAPGTHHFEARLRTQTGDVRDVRVSADLIGRHAENVILALVEDITERKRANERARRNAKQMRQYAADMARYAQEARGHEAERQQHTTLLERMVRLRTVELEAANEELKKEIAAHQSEIRVREEAETKLREVLQSLEDTMLAFRRSEELLRIGIDAAGMVAWTYDPAKDEVVTLARTERWAQMMPEKSAPLLGRGLEYVHPDDRAKVTEELSRALAGEAFSLELRLLLPNGEVRWIVTQGRLLTGAVDQSPVLVGVTQDITARRQFEDQLRRLNRELDAERARWQGVVEGIADEVWVADAEGKMSLINLPEMTAMGLEEFTDKTVAQVYEEVDILNPDGQVRAHQDAPLIRALEGEIVRGEEIMRHRGTGRTRYRQFSAAPTRDAAGTITGAVAIVRDITDQKRTEQALAQANERTADILESIEDGFFALNREWKFTYLNRRSSAIFNLPPGELIGERIWEKFPQLLGSALETAYRRAMAERVPAELEFSGVLTGTYYYIRIYPSAEGISVYWIDISERKRTQEEIKTLARFPAENPNPVLRLDPAGVILYANEASAPLLEVWGISVGEAVPDSLCVVVADAFETQQGRIIDVELKGRFYSFSIAPVQESGYVNLYGRDITDRKRAETQVQQLNQDLSRRATELEIANKELESFTYSVSHDLRAPLSFIDAITTTLQQDYGAQLPEQVQSRLDLIRANSEQMDALITSLLALSRLIRQPLQKRQVDMTGLVHEALGTLQKEIQRPDLTIDVQNLPAAAADPVLTKQVWVNLIANAIKFTRKCKGARIEVGFGPTDGEERVYYVRDNGVGFDMQQADRLFGVFQRLHSEVEYEGTGVGLAIVQRIIHRHGGRVWAQGRVGKGATFYFTLG